MFSDDIIQEIRAYALAEAREGREACGLVLADRFMPCVNKAEDPAQEFRIAPDVYAAHANDVRAIVHSHLASQGNYPSREDMEGQIASAVPWGIAFIENDYVRDLFWWGDGVPMAPLVGREFRHGVHDCYSAVRDWYRVEKAIILPEVPRDYEWWANGKDNLYVDQFLQHGFVRISESEVQPGDGFLAQIMADKPNHAGIYVGDGLIFHHLVMRLSKFDPVGRWGTKFVTHWLRFVGKPSGEKS